MSDSIQTMNMVLPQASVDRLMALQEKMGAKDLAEVAENAFRVLEALIDEADTGSKFFIKREDADIVPFDILG